MLSIEELHTNSMNIAEDAFIAQRKGDHEKAVALFRQALDYEQQAAELLSISLESEPSRSILYRSAASLAYNAQDYQLADRLIAQGLSGYPPEEIKDELKNLYEDVNFFRHLKSRGLILDKTQWLLTIAGDAVKYGATAAEQLMTRVDRVSSLFYRTVERLLKLPYRVTGGVDKVIKQHYGLFINTFSPASFAVSFQVGSPDPQQSLPGFELEQIVEPCFVVDELMNCFEIFEKDEPKVLKEHIFDEDYFENFVGLAKEIAPDGKNIKLVGFTSVRDGLDRPVALRKNRKEIRRDLDKIQSLDQDTSRVPFTRSGILMYANTPLRGKYGTVKLKEKATAEKLDIKVSVSIMKDVVQPYYEENVTVLGYTKDGKNYLEEISLDVED
jgi:hypothetical protein